MTNINAGRPARVVGWHLNLPDLSMDMRIQVESNPSYLGVEVPNRFRLDGREVEVMENVDQWHGADYRYFKVKGDDGNLYILRFDEGHAEWELTMFQSPAAASFLAHAVKRRRPDGG